MRECKTCRKILEADQFSPSTYNRPMHYSVICKNCYKESNRARAKVSSGYIYIITNPAWYGWCKIGLTTTSCEERLKSYQTGAPFRDYIIYASKYVEDVYRYEREVHDTLISEFSINSNNEWFNILPEEAIKLLF